MDSQGAFACLLPTEMEASTVKVEVPSRREESADTPTDLQSDVTPTLRQCRKPLSNELNVNELSQAVTREYGSGPWPSGPARAESDASNSTPNRNAEYSTATKMSTSWRPTATAVLSSRLMMLASTLLIAISLLHETPFLAKTGTIIPGASAEPIDKSMIRRKDGVDGKLLLARENTDTNVCSRWSQQSAVVNGTIFVYGGHATTTQGQTSGTWTNDFFTIDVTKSWDISAPVVSGLAQPSGPPNVSNGYLWNSYNSLFLYGGEFSDTPFVTPSPFSLWEYDIAKSSWTEHKDPQTSAGNNSDPANQPVQRAAEGAGISVPELGRGYYFAGHVDQSTTPGWSNQIFRVYLKSLVEYTFPGHTNSGVQSLSGGKTAGNDGVWRNITQGGIQDTATFPNRADSALVYVPGYGANGILVSIGGGTNVSFVSRIRSPRESNSS